MRIKNECIPCMVRQAVEAAELMSDNKAMQEKIIKGGVEKVSQIDFSETAPEVARSLHTLVKEITGNPDPYKALKEMYNKIAEDWVAEMHVKTF